MTRSLLLPAFALALVASPALALPLTALPLGPYVGTGTFTVSWHGVTVPVCETDGVVAIHAPGGSLLDVPPTWDVDFHFPNEDPIGFECYLSGDAVSGAAGSAADGFTFDFDEGCNKHSLRVAPLGEATSVVRTYDQTCAGWGVVVSGVVDFTLGL